MLPRIHDLLAGSTPLLLFTVIGLGWFAGSVKVRGFSLGVAGVLFVGLVFGALDPEAYRLPELVSTLGLVLFVYTIGLQSGPLFFSLFRRQATRLLGLVAAALGVSAAVAVGLGALLGLPAGLSAGLWCGALTNTPALAAAVDRLRAATAGLPEATARPILDGPTVGYSIAYPFGVAGLVIAMALVARRSRADFEEEKARAQSEAGLVDDLLIRELQVANPQIVGRTAGEAMLADLTGMIFTRVQRAGKVELLGDGHRLAAGDILIGVGTVDAVRKAELAVGPLVEAGLDQGPSTIDHRDFVVLRRDLAGTTVRELPARLGGPVVVSRLRRGGLRLPPTPKTPLEAGDELRLVAHRDVLERATELLGNPLREVTETDFLSFSLGLILGVVAGMVPIPIGGGRFLELGFAGGPLVVGLLLGRQGRSGPIVWSMPLAANLAMRQLGLVLFLAAVGTRAGGSFLATLREQGPALLGAGVAVTVASMATVLFLARQHWKTDLISTFGLLAGVHTQPAALAYAGDLSGSDDAGISYVAIYPVALVAKIILAQVLVGL